MVIKIKCYLGYTLELVGAKYSSAGKVVTYGITCPLRVKSLT